METVGFCVPTGWKSFWNIPSHLLTTIYFTFTLSPKGILSSNFPFFLLFSFHFSLPFAFCPNLSFSSFLLLFFNTFIEVQFPHNKPHPLIYTYTRETSTVVKMVNITITLKCVLVHICNTSPNQPHARALQLMLFLSRIITLCFLEFL